MDTLQLPKKRENVAEEEVAEERPKQGAKGCSQSPTKKQQQSAPSTFPPSASSSPTHEFSFTISLHPSSTTIPSDKTKSSPPSSSSFAVDLSPADDIFFHGHLLPLHLLSHLPISPRSSTNSLDSSTILPVIKDLSDSKPNSNNSSCSSSSSTSTSTTNSSHSSTGGTKGRRKFKSLSLFGLAKWQKGCDVSEKDNNEDDDGEKKKKKKKKIRFDVGHILKRYVRMVRPLFLFSSERKENRQFLRQPHSFSGNYSSWRGNYKQERRGRRGGGGQFSAPASMQTSPSNSGLLLATDINLPSHTSDSTMEELQNAIQAAIAHCKNSIAMKEEKLNC